MANIFSRAAQAQRPAVPAQPMRPRPALPQVAPAPNMTQMGVAPPTLRSALQGDLRTSDLPTNALAQQMMQQQMMQQMQQNPQFQQMQAQANAFAQQHQQLVQQMPEYQQLLQMDMAFRQSGQQPTQQDLQRMQELDQRIQQNPQMQALQQRGRQLSQQQDMLRQQMMQPSGLFGGQSPTQMQAQPQISPMFPESFRQRPPIPLELLQAQVDPQRELENQRYRETLNTPQAISAHAGYPARPPYVPPQPSFQPSYSPRGFGPTDGGFRTPNPNDPRLANPMTQPAAGGSSFSGNWANAGNANQQANPFNQGIGSIGPSRTDTFNKFGGPFGGM